MSVASRSLFFQDIGFDGIAPYVGFDNTVINTYFDVFFPKAVRFVMAAPLDTHPCFHRSTSPRSSGSVVDQKRCGL